MALQGWSSSELLIPRIEQFAVIEPWVFKQVNREQFRSHNPIRFSVSELSSRQGGAQPAASRGRGRIAADFVYTLPLPPLFRAIREAVLLAVDDADRADRVVPVFQRPPEFEGSQPASAPLLEPVSPSSDARRVLGNSGHQNRRDRIVKRPLIKKRETGFRRSWTASIFACRFF